MALSFEPRNPGCLTAFKECLEALLAQTCASEEEKKKAAKDLRDICTMGRMSEDSLAIPSQIQESHSYAKPSQEQMDKKKRSAGGF